MRKLLFVVAMTVALVMFSSGCGGENEADMQGESALPDLAEGGSKLPRAASFDSEVAPMFPGQQVSPYSGQPISKDAYVDHEGKRIYFASPSEAKTFKAAKNKGRILQILDRRHRGQ